MARKGAQRFEDLVAWQRARCLTNRIYQLTQASAFSRDFALQTQVRRASVSVMANIAEGFGRRTHRDFANFLNVAMGSCMEVRSHLYIAIDIGYVTELEGNEAIQLAEEVCRVIGALRASLNT